MLKNAKEARDPEIDHTFNSDPVSLGSIKGQARKTRQPKTFTKRELSALRQTFQELAP